MIFYVATLRTIDRRKDEEVLEEHKAYLQKYIDEGKIYAKGPFSDHTGGLVIYSTKDKQEAREIIENDPVIVHSSRTYELKEWKSNL
nr:YciI family protein [Tissierella sp.]